MKIMSRDFTTREKIMLLVLTLILLAAGYYAVIDQPIRTAINEAKIPFAVSELILEYRAYASSDQGRFFVPHAERAGFHRTEWKPGKNGKLQ